MQYFLILILLIIIIWAFARFILRPVRKPSGYMEKKYIELSHQPPHIARQTLEEEINRLKEKHPGRSRKWYMDKILYDLQKDR